MKIPEWADASLLTHPNIPKPLHGVNPRTIFGQEWWDAERKKAYAEKNQCCHACGTHRSQVKGPNKWLEAHERYKIDYKNGRIYFNGLVALCPYCHAFIHSGRLYSLYSKGEKSRQETQEILLHGLHVLTASNRQFGTNLKPFGFTLAIAYEIREWMSQTEALFKVHEKGYFDDEPTEFAPWASWRLVIDGNEYPPIFESMKAWAEHYGYDIDENSEGYWE